jgi:PAS domain S-box-containing protein
VRIEEQRRQMGSTPYVTLYLFAAFVAVAVAMFAWQRRYYRGGRPFAFTMLALGFWLACQGLALSTDDPHIAIGWTLLEYGGIVVIGPLYLLIAIAYSGQWRQLNRVARSLLFVPPLIFFIIALTTLSTGLWWRDVVIDNSGYMYLVIQRGPVFWIHTIYSYACIMVGIGLFVYAVLFAPPLHRYQSAVMLASAAIPVIGNIAYLFFAFRVPALDDPTPFLLLMMGLIVYYATLRYQMLDLAPIAEREVFASLPDGVIVLDTQGNVASINQLAAHLLAVSEARPLGKHLRSMLPPALSDSEFAHGLRAVQNARTYQCNVAEGHGERGLEIRVRPLPAANGRPAGALLVVRDTTQRLHIEQARSRHINELNLISSIARAANTAVETKELLETLVHTLVASGVWQRVVIGLNDRAEGCIGTIVDSAREDQALLELVSDHDPYTEAFAPLHQRIALRLTPDDPPFTATPAAAWMRRAGMNSVLVVPLIQLEERLGLLFLVEQAADSSISDPMRLAETIGQLVTDAIVRIHLYEEVRRANQLKTSFLASVSHELRTPLTSITGYIDLLGRGIYGSLPERAKEPLAFVRYSSTALLTQINDILDFTRMEAGHLRVDLQPVEPLHAISNVVGVLQPQVRERGLQLKLDIQPGLPLVMANTARIEQVLTNLVSNAIKFTDRGLITVSAQSQGAFVRISVRDTGIGIAAENLAVIFEEFRRVEHQGRRYGGTGLGLAISRHLVELMGGTLSVESELGNGSVFHLDLRAVLIPVVEPATVMARP